MEKELRELHEKMDYIIELLRKGNTFPQKEVKVVNQIDPTLLETT